MSGFRYDSPDNYHLTYSDAPRAQWWLSREFAGACFFILVFFPACLWIFSIAEHTEFIGNRRGRGSGFTWLLLQIPVYIRFPLAVLVIGGITSAIVAYIIRLRDRRPDFLFGPEGVAHIGLFVSKSLLWSDIASLDIVEHRRRNLFLRKPRHNGWSAEFVPKRGHAAIVRARSKFSALLAVFQTSTVKVNLSFFDMTPERFEALMLDLRPDLAVNRTERVRWD